jgi:4-hydroxy-L-threonine phosphate dehydrogenase PdxA
MTQLTIALFTGDPAGIGPELVQKLLNHDIAQQATKIILIGQKGSIQTPANVSWHDWSGLNTPPFPKATYDANNGAYMIAALAEGASLVRDGKAHAFCFAPLNKSALRLGGMHQEDELRWFAEFLNYQRRVWRTQCAARPLDIACHVPCGSQRSEQFAKQPKSFLSPSR